MDNIKKNLEVGIINGSLTSPNLGVQALTYSIIQIFNEICDEINLNLKITLIDSFDKYSQNHIYIGDKNIPIISKVFKTSKKLIFDKNYQSNISYLIKCDLVLDLGGGDSWSDIYGKKRFYVSWVTLFTLSLKKIPVIFPPQTIGPFKNNLVRIFANFIMKKCVSIYPRDEISAKYLSKYLPTKRYYTIPDIGGYSKNNQFGLKSNYKDLMENIIDFFIKKDNVKVFLIPHVIERSEDNVEDDIFACKEIKKKYGECNMAPVFSSPIEAKSFISKMNFFIGARMHSCIAAFSSNVPVVPLGYSRKFLGLFTNTLNYSQLIDLKVCDIETTIDYINNAFNSSMDLKTEILGINNNLKQKRIEFKDLLKEDLASI